MGWKLVGDFGVFWIKGIKNPGNGSALGSRANLV